MSFKNLALNQAIIKNVLFKYSPQATVSGPTQKGGITEYLITMPGETGALLHFYFKKDGSTTINPKTGLNQPLSTKVAEFVKAGCAVQKTNRGHLYLKHVSAENFEMILDFLKIECGATVDTSSEISSGKQYKIHGQQGDTLSFNYYTNGAFQIQGKPFLLYNDVIEILSELLDYKDIVASQLKCIDADLSVSDITSEFQQALPNSYDFLGSKTRSIIAPAFAWLKINIELTDYTSMVFPALKGLEGYLKLLFSKHEIVIQRDGFGFYFRSDPSHLTLDAQNKIGCSATCRAIEDVYNYYKVNRHGLFHVDSRPGTSRILTKRNDADDIVRKSLSLIESTYTSIPV